MIFHQLFEPLSFTYTYLIACEKTRQAILVDPVYNTAQRDIAELNRLELDLVYTLETHIHADHITSALELKKQTGSKIVAPAINNIPCVDVAIADGSLLQVGELTITSIHTPGHTNDHFCYVVKDRVLTGDTLLIDGCGRTDFQNGDTVALYKSIHEKLFTLPDDYLVYPAHDYEGRHVSTIAQEKQRNKRLGGGKTLSEFITIMQNLNLPYPKFIDYAIPGNKQCGVCPHGLPEQMKAYCESMKESPQG